MDLALMSYTPEEKEELFPHLTYEHLPRVYSPADTEVAYPADLVALDSQGLSNTYGAFMGWAGYCKYNMTLVESKILALKSIQKAYMNTLGKDYAEVKPSKAKQLMLADTDLVKLDTFIAELTFEFKNIEARYEYFDSCAKALSRELSRRISETEKTKLF